MKNSDKSFAFTLAETLLTLTIAGVLMAVMMRAINRVNPDKEKILFLKTFHAMEAVMADTINDPTKYSPNYYADNEIEKMSDEEKSSLHLDFRYTPMPSARVTVIEDGVQKTACPSVTKGDGTIDKQGCDIELTRNNALCYFTAAQMNTIGEINCKNGDGITVNGKKEGGINMRFSNGACIGWLNGPDADGIHRFSIVPSCNAGDKNLRYAVYITTDGKLTVPEEDENANQTKAFEWMNDQTTVK